MKNYIIAFLVIIIIGGGVYLFIKKPFSALPTTPAENTASSVVPTVEVKESTVIGSSVEKRDITAYHFGTGPKEILFVGGIHGGYSWNTTLLAYELMDYLKANPSAVSNNLKITVIPVLNPDGLFKVVGKDGPFTNTDVSSSQTTLVSGRFNANKVDLSRNFDCNWKSVGVWQTKNVSGGSKVFSEPEALVFKNYVEEHKPVAVVVWYSSAGGVYSSSCNSGILPETSAITDIYAKASGYPAHKSFDFYETTGDTVNWLAKINIPAISVLLTNHQDTEWDKNKKGFEAILEHYAK